MNAVFPAIDGQEHFRMPSSFSIVVKKLPHTFLSPLFYEGFGAGFSARTFHDERKKKIRINSITSNDP